MFLLPHQQLCPLIFGIVFPPETRWPWPLYPYLSLSHFSLYSLIPLQFLVDLIGLPITQCYKKQGVVAASGWIHLPPVCLLFSPARLVPQMSHIHPLNWQFYFSLFCVLPLFPVTICGIKEKQAFVEINKHICTFCTIRIIFRWFV